MSTLIPQSFETSEIEISSSISILRKHGINLTLNDALQNKINASTLFDGSDGLFKQLIDETKIYFEYGCGKSTEYVFKFTDAKIFSVDTSKTWVARVSNLEENNKRNSQRLAINWVDVGEVAEWGYPISFKKRKNFINYTNWFWTLDLKPDLVLIDGRFRISCFLNSIKYAEVGTKILFDDYLDRQFYHIAEEILPASDYCGRQALFIVNEKAKNLITNELLKSFENVVM